MIKNGNKKRLFGCEYKHNEIATIYISNKTAFLIQAIEDSLIFFDAKKIKKSGMMLRNINCSFLFVTRKIGTTPIEKIMIKKDKIKACT
jgi:hypothetical protein